MTKTIDMGYHNCEKCRKKIDELLRLNASYQAQNQGVCISATEKKRINSYCNANFIRPIKDIDEQFYKLIEAASN